MHFLTARMRPAPPYPSSTDRKGRTPLILASFLGHLGLVQLLLENKASRSSMAKVRALQGGGGAARAALARQKSCSSVHITPLR
jgi:ankyrin repeat protein